MTSKQWTCDKCGKPLSIREARYALADDFEARTSRHWACHKPAHQVVAEAQDELAQIKERLAELRRQVRGE